MIILFKIIRSIAVGVIMGGGLTLTIICVTLFWIIKNSFRIQTNNEPKNE